MSYRETYEYQQGWEEAVSKAIWFIETVIWDKHFFKEEDLAELKYILRAED